MVPEVALFAVDDTEEWLPLITRVSKPPRPPSIAPLSAPPLATTNVSLLPALPTMSSNPLKDNAPTEPAFSPVNVHVVSAVGPSSVFPVPLARIAATFENVTPAVPAPLTVPPAPFSATAAPDASSRSVLFPAPPSNETATPIAPTVSVSSPLPPVICTEETAETGRVSVVPLTVSEMSEPLVAMAIVLAAPPVAISQTAGAGDGLGEGLALGEGDGLGDGSGDALGVGETLGDGSGVVDGDGSGVVDGDGSGVVDGDGSGVVDGDGSGVVDGDGGSLGDGDGVGSSSDIEADVGIQRLAIFDPFPCSAPAGAYVGAGVGDGAGVVDGRAVAEG